MYLPHLYLPLFRQRYETVCNTWIHNTTVEQFDDPRFYTRNANETAEIEDLRRNGYAELVLILEQIRMLEDKLNIKERLTEDTPEWQTATREANELQYRWAVDHLESLVVSRLFELAKMNRVGTGEYCNHNTLSLLIAS